MNVEVSSTLFFNFKVQNHCVKHPCTLYKHPQDTNPKRGVSSSLDVKINTLTWLYKNWVN